MVVKGEKNRPSYTEGNVSGGGNRFVFSLSFFFSSGRYLEILISKKNSKEEERYHHVTEV